MVVLFVCLPTVQNKAAYWQLECCNSAQYQIDHKTKLFLPLPFSFICLSPTLPQFAMLVLSELGDECILLSESSNAVHEVTTGNSLHMLNLLEHSAEVYPGALHGQLCTEEEFLEIPSDYGRHDLVDGVLFAHDMADDNYCAIKHSIYHRFLQSMRHSTGNKNHTGRIGATVRLGRKRVAIPDLVFGIHTDEPKSKFTFDCSGKTPNCPELVVEVTSSNRKNDLTRKKTDYAAAGISNY